MEQSQRASKFKDERATRERLEKFISIHEFMDCNLRGVLYGERRAFSKIWHADFGQERVRFETAKEKLNQNGALVSKGFSFGPTWSTHWFKVELTVPSEWVGKRVHFHWDSGCEGMLWSEKGEPLKGFASAPYNKYEYPLSGHLAETDCGTKRLFVECGANEMFGAGEGGMIQPPNPDRTFTIQAAEIVVFNWDAFQLLRDFEILIGMATLLPESSHERYRALYTGNSIINSCDPQDPQTVRNGHEVAQKYFSRENSPSQFKIYAISNCHIDTAWLWPYAETRRKVGRSWATALSLMEEYPQQVFAISQAVQVAWLRQDYPGLFARVQEAVRKGQFVVVGGSWVEMDGNIPSGEAFARQLLYGQKEFHQSFGRYCTEFWLPDTFGYSAQLPQIISSAGMKRFVTQKMSWNFQNRFPHHTFWWEGLDGSRVLSHFPPGDSYTQEVTVENALKSSQSFQDKGRSNSAIMLYGFGDGGGGPSAEMLERLRRMKNVNGLPSHISAGPADYFESVEASETQNLCTWSGELYLELHNGTYTTQALVKKRNRQLEFLLRDCEFADTLKFFKGGKVGSWEEEWKKVLLNQFHDVLPGTSIGEVYQDAHSLYNQALATCEGTVQGIDHHAKKDPETVLNSLPWERVITIGDHQYRIPGLCATQLGKHQFETSHPVKFKAKGANFIIKNQNLEAEIDPVGGIRSFKLIDSQLKDPSLGELVGHGSEGLNQFCIYDDVPLYWDAWDVMDYHLETRKRAKEIVEPLRVVSSSPVSVMLQLKLRIGKQSTLTQKIILRAEQKYLEFETEVDWNESHKFLKVEFPVNVRSQRATYEIQFGHLTRPTHSNNSWDAAMFEVCGHKWGSLGEKGLGLAVLNDSKYGYSCEGNVLSLSLLRSPKAPDPGSDMGRHTFKYALQPHTGVLESVIRCAYELNCSVKSLPLGSEGSFGNWESDSVILEAVKVSEDQKGVVCRAYESSGGKGLLSFTPNFTVQKVWFCNFLEAKQSEVPGFDQSGKVQIILEPFKIVSLYLEL